MTIDDLQKQVSSEKTMRHKLTEGLLKVAEEKSRRASLMKEQEELIQNKENMLERASLLRKKLKANKNEVVKCIGEQFWFQTMEFIKSILSQSTRPTQRSVSSRAPARCVFAWADLKIKLPATTIHIFGTKIQYLCDPFLWKESCKYVKMQMPFCPSPK